ncbi:hypothetical protein PICSAR26_00733 [Mycobacterium avium subsp. paratuberculosis]|nr:hypothetical protein PICSAR26_00733 [Mycobacterium avium subsp. paratuberculosis]
MQRCRGPRAGCGDAARAGLDRGRRVEEPLPAAQRRLGVQVGEVQAPRLRRRPFDDLGGHHRGQAQRGQVGVGRQLVRLDAEHGCEVLSQLGGWVVGCGGSVRRLRSRRYLMDDLELARGETVERLASSDLSGRRGGKRATRHPHHALGSGLVVGQDATAQDAAQVVEVFDGRAGFQHQPPLAVCLGGVGLHGAGAPRRHPAMGFLDGLLDVVRKVVTPANDDQVAVSAADVEFALVAESRVPGTQVWTEAVCGPGAECCRRLFRLPPVPVRQTRTSDPYFADFAIGQRHMAVRIDNLDIPAEGAIAAADQGAGATVRRVGLRHFDGDAALQCVSVEALFDPYANSLRACHSQTGLGEAILRRHDIIPQTSRPEFRSEVPQRGSANRFGAIGRKPQTRQVQTLQRGTVKGFDTAAIREIGSADPISAEPADCLKPDSRIAYEIVRRDERRATAVEQRHEHAPEDPHIVVERQPADHVHVVVAVPHIRGEGRLPQNRLMGVDNTFGFPGRSGRILEEGDVFSMVGVGGCATWMGGETVGRRGRCADWQRPEDGITLEDLDQLAAGVHR